MSACYCDFEPNQVYRSESRIARVAHRCDECQRTILPREQYEAVDALSDGSWWRCKTCSDCLALRDWVKAHVPCFCMEHHNLIDGAIEAAQEWSHEAPGLLFGAYRRQVWIQRRRTAQRLNSPTPPRS